MLGDRKATRNGTRARSVGRLCGGAACVALVVAGCASTPPPEARGLTNDFEAPRPKLVASLLDAASYREARHDLEGALRNAERAHAAAPQSGAAALREAELRAWSAIRAGDDSGLAEARDAIREIVAQYPDAPRPRLADARLELAVGDRAKTAAEASRLIEESPKSAAAYALLARAVLEDDPLRARDLAGKAVELAPSDPDALAARASALAAFNDYNGAADDARRALRFRSDPELVEILALRQIRGGSPRGAIREIEGLLEAERTVSLEVLLARAKARLEDYTGADAAVVRAKTLAGDDAEKQIDALEAAVFIGIARGTPVEELAEVQAVRKLGPDDSRLAELEALAEDALGRHAEAEVDARRAVELDPNSLSAWHMLANVLDHAGVKPPAFERARATFGGDAARGHALAGRLAELKSDFEAARREFEAALALDPNLAFAQLGVAQHSVKADAPRALALAEKARGALGWNIATGRTLGVALYENDRAVEAVDVLQIGIGTSDPWPGAAVPLQIALAFALGEAGEKEAALRQARTLMRSVEKADAKPSWLADLEALEAKLDPPKKPAAKESAPKKAKKPAAGAPKPPDTEAQAAPASR